MSHLDLAALRAASRRSEVGKSTGNALYVHRLSIPRLPTELRFYVTGALKLALPEPSPPWNVLKIHLHQPIVSFLWYPRFVDHSHPALLHSTIYNLATGRKKFHREAQENPSILHRKELMIGKGDPRYAEWALLTAKEEKLGYYADPPHIGRRRGWERAIQNAKAERACRREP